MNIKDYMRGIQVLERLSSLGRRVVPHCFHLDVHAMRCNFCAKWGRMPPEVSSSILPLYVGCGMHMLPEYSASTAGLEA